MIRIDKKRKPVSRRRTNAGVTLAELIVASVVALILGIIIYTFILFSSKSLRKVLAMQMLQQEGSRIAEVFRNRVRNASYVTVGYDDPPEPPERNTAQVKAIRLWDTDGSIMANFDITDDILYLDVKGDEHDQVLSRNLWVGGDPPTEFEVFKYGNHVKFYLNLQRSVGDETMYLQHVVGDVRCKNWVNF